MEIPNGNLRKMQTEIRGTSEHNQRGEFTEKGPLVTKMALSHAE